MTYYKAKIIVNSPQKYELYKRIKNSPAIISIHQTYGISEIELDVEIDDTRGSITELNILADNNLRKISKQESVHFDMPEDHYSINARKEKENYDAAVIENNFEDTLTTQLENHIFKEKMPGTLDEKLLLLDKLNEKELRHRHFIRAKGMEETDENVHAVEGAEDMDETVRAFTEVVRL